MAKELAQWQAISGITPQNENGMDYPLREQGLRKLLNDVEAILRAEISAAEAAQPQQHFTTWDPILKICFNLGISRARLSRYSREYNGLGIHEFYDAVRIETIKPQVKKRMAAFLKTVLKSGGRNAGNQAEWKSPQDAARHCFLLLRKSRRENPGFDRNQWIREEYNFPNYTRYRKACMNVFVRTPLQLELEALQELIEEMWLCARDSALPTEAPGASQGATFFTMPATAQTEERTAPPRPKNAEIAA